HPAEAMWQAIAEYRRCGWIDDALRLCLDYPHTQAAQKTFRAFPERTLEYFHAVVYWDADHPNGNYALGLALITLGRAAEATPGLRRAGGLAPPGPRGEEIPRSLERIEPGGGMPSAAVSRADIEPADKFPVPA